MQVHPITTQEVVFFASLWLVAFASTIARAVRDGDTSNFFRHIGLGATSGFLAVGICGCWVDSGASGDPRVSPWFWIGVASFIGGSIKEQDKIRMFLWDRIFGSEENKKNK